MKVLGADLGGTKTALMVAEVDGDHVTPVYEGQYRSADFGGLAELVHAFVDDAGDPARGIDAACFAVAGPVSEDATGQSARITNLPWEMTSAGLAEALALPAVRLVNDFQAVGHGLDALADTDVVSLQTGRPLARAPRVLIGAGTGLGHAVMVWQGDAYGVLASEGGHVDFAPHDAEQQAMLEALWAEHGHASWERVVSGPGLVWLFEFLRRHTGIEPGEALGRAMAEQDPAAAISEAAIGGRDTLATRALEHFVRLYGAQAGNLALTVLARGGIYVAGGIAPRILEWLRRGPFLESLLAKGRMRPVLEAMPVRVVVNPRVGLLGATRAAQWAQ